MKKEFLYLLSLAFTSCLPANVYSMEDQVSGSIKIGNAFYSWKATNVQEKFCEYIKKYLTMNQEAGEQQSFKFPSSENSNEVAIEIGREGDLYVNRVERFIIKGLDKKIIADTSASSEQSDSANSESLDEASIKEKIEKLQAGESITAFFPGNSQVSVTFDQIIKLVSKIDKEHKEYPARLSQIASSALIRVGLSNGQGREDKKIELESTGQEIKTFLDFVTADEKKRKKLINKLSIFEHIMLVVDLHEHDFPKEFFSDCQDSLIKKIFDSLEESDLAWHQKISSLPEDQKIRIQPIIGKILNEVIKPIPQDLLEEKNKKISEFCFTADGKKAIIKYRDKTGEIINLITGKTILEGKNVHYMEVNADGTMAIVGYNIREVELRDLETGKIFPMASAESMFITADRTKAVIITSRRKGKLIDFKTGGTILERENVSSIEVITDTIILVISPNNGHRKVEIIDLTTPQKTIFENNNIHSIQVTPDGTKAIIDDLYNTKIIDLKTGDTIFERDDIISMDFTADSTKVIVIYNDRRGEIRDLKTNKPILERENIDSMKVNADGTMVIVKYNNDSEEIINLKTNDSILKRNVLSIQVNVDWTKAIVKYNDSRIKEIIDLITNEIIEIENVDIIKFNANGTKVVVIYFGGKGGIIDLKTKKIIPISSEEPTFEERIQGIHIMEVNKDGTKAIVKYNDNSWEIIDLKTFESIFNGYNIRKIQVNADGTKALIIYLDNEMEILDIADYDRGINFAKFNPEQLIFIFNLNQDPKYRSDIRDVAEVERICQSFNPDVQQKLKESYFPELDFSL